MVKELVDSSDDGHGVVSTLLTAAELALASFAVDRQGVLVSLLEKDTTGLYVDTHGVLTEMSDSSDERDGVVSLPFTVTEIPPAGVDGLDIMLSLAGDFSVLSMEELGVIVSTVVCSVNGCEVVLISLTSELTAACIDGEYVSVSV